MCIYSGAHDFDVMRQHVLRDPNLFSQLESVRMRVYCLRKRTLCLSYKNRQILN